jgi:hypothetical protein
MGDVDMKSPGDARSAGTDYTGVVASVRLRQIHYHKRLILWTNKNDAITCKLLKNIIEWSLSLTLFFKTLAKLARTGE